MTTVDATISGPDDFRFELGGGLLGDASRAVSRFCRAVEEGRADGICEMSQASGVMGGDVVLAILDAVEMVKCKVDGEVMYVEPGQLSPLVDPEATYHFWSVEF